MWADNETRVDLLGFDFLVDELLVVLRDSRLLPITVGVAGDWGSGKSSLMGIAEDILAAEPNFLTVSFSPWRFEDYEDVKTALMAWVIGALQERVRGDESIASKARGRLGRLVRRVNFLGAAQAVGRAALIAHGTDLPPEVTALAGIQPLKPETDLESEDEAPDRLHSVSDFRTEFAALMDELDVLQALIVFIDDLDRCLPDSIIDTFEAIRLFLHVPKTAYVIAADQRIAQAAIEARYPASRQGDESLGVDYLERRRNVRILASAREGAEQEPQQQAGRVVVGFPVPPARRNAAQGHQRWILHAGLWSLTGGDEIIELLEAAEAEVGLAPLAKRSIEMMRRAPYSERLLYLVEQSYGRSVQNGRGEIREILGRGKEPTTKVAG
jgi:hypothetical protein